MSNCIGCGSPLQYKDKNAIGYTENKENKLCERCFKLKNYGSYQKVSLNNDDYQKILDSIPKTSCILYVTDILTLDCTEINKFKNVILVITKKDIMPKSIKSEKIIKYMKETYKNILDIFVISSKTGEGITEMFQKIKKYKKLYVIGTTNAGKSTLINKLINFYGNNNDTITTSIYPSTTLNKIEIKLKDITLIDTPGLINQNNITNYITNKEIKKITPKKEIKPKTCQIEGEGSIIIDKYAKINYKTQEKNSITIYASNALNIHYASLKKELINSTTNNLKVDEKNDIIIPGLCYIKCVHKLDVTISTLNGVKPYTRKNLI